MIVPGEGFSPAGNRWVSCRPDFLLPVQVLSRLFRRLCLEQLAIAHGAGSLQFFNAHAPLANAKAFDAYLAPLRDTEWFVYAKKPFGGPEQVLRYMARYTHRVLLFQRVTKARGDNPLQCRERLGGLLRYYHQNAA